MKKIVFTIALLSILCAASYASTFKGNLHYNLSSESLSKPHKNLHHTHIVVPFDHYSI